jgi:hypothetical protein
MAQWKIGGQRGRRHLGAMLEGERTGTSCCWDATLTARFGFERQHKMRQMFETELRVSHSAHVATQ